MKETALTPPFRERAELRIRVFGDPALRRKAKPVTKITRRHGEILGEMLRLMREASGIGLASPQVGIHESMIVVDIGTASYKLINPKVVKKEGAWVMQEGCLSVPGVCLKVKRAKRVVIEARNECFEPVTIEAQDLLACVLQHEIDHLRGRLIVDYASLWEKFKIRGILERLKERVRNEGLPESATKSCQLQL